MLARDSRYDGAIEWLLGSEEPAVRYMAARDLLDETRVEDAARIPDGPKVRVLLAGHRAEGGFGVHPYKKWHGAHWRLVSLVELELPAGNRIAAAAAGQVLDWLTGDEHRARIQAIDGLVRRCASQEGNALAVCSRLGLHDDERVRLLAQSLLEWQWPDGGWNCDVDATGARSSFHESLTPMWGLYEWWKATGDRSALDASHRTAELLLQHRLFRSSSSGDVIHPEWLKLHYPPYWHYDILQALLMFARMGLVGDPRASDALDVIERKRLADGRWRPGNYWWASPGTRASNEEVVDWGRSAPNEMITLNAMRVLTAAGRA